MSTKPWAMSVASKLKTVKFTVVASSLAAGLVACSVQSKTTEQSADQAQGGYVTDEFFPAIQRSDVARIRELVASGADVNFNYIGGFEWTPLIHTAYLEEAEIAKVLLNAGPMFMERARMKAQP